MELRGGQSHVPYKIKCYSYKPEWKLGGKNVAHENCVIEVESASFQRIV